MIGSNIAFKHIGNKAIIQTGVLVKPLFWLKHICSISGEYILTHGMLQKGRKFVINNYQEIEE